MPTANETIEEFAGKEYQYGFVTDMDADAVPAGLNEDVIRTISAKKNEPEWLLEWRLKAYRHWLTMEDPAWHNVHVTPVDYQSIIYYSAPKPKKQLAVAGRSGPGDAGDVRQAGHLAPGAEAAVQRRRGRRVRQRLRRHHVQGNAGREGHHLLLVLRGRAGASRPGARVPRLRRPLLRQLLRDAELGRLHRRLVLLHPQGRPLPDGAVHLLPHQRRQHRPVRADAADRRRGRRTSPTWKAAPRRCATRTSCTPPSSNWSP